MYYYLVFFTRLVSTVTHLEIVVTVVIKGKQKGKFHPIAGRKGPEVELSYSCTLSLTSALDGCGWSTSRPGHFTPRKDPVPIV